MSTAKGSISTHILDTSRGEPARDVPVKLSKLTNDHQWQQINEGRTNSDGRCSGLISNEQFTPGCYKLHFDTSGGYFNRTSTKTLYPFIEIIFHCEENQHYHIPLLLNPYGYSTYRGS